MPGRGVLAAGQAMEGLRSTDVLVAALPLDSSTRHLVSRLWLTSLPDIEAGMPKIDERLRLAEITMVALATQGGAELPPKTGIHPRPNGSFAHAMPPYLHRFRIASDWTVAPSPDVVRAHLTGGR